MKAFMRFLLETKIEVLSLKDIWIVFISYQESILVSWKDYVHWSKSNCVRKKHMLHAHKGSCCDIGNMFLGVRRESIKLTFLEILIPWKDCLARWVGLISSLVLKKGKLTLLLYLEFYA